MKNYLVQNQKDKKLLNELYEIPSKDKGLDMPRTQVFIPNFAHQSDILYLPSDNGFKYALVVVDVHSKKCDAVPLRDSSATSVLKAFKKIYDENKILDMPYIIQVDQGSEFKGVVTDYFDEN